MIYQFSDFCVCPNCRSELTHIRETLQCPVCQTSYAIRDGIPILLPNYEDDKQKRYHENYERIAENFLSTNKYAADNVAGRHEVLLKFIGKNKRYKRVLDIGSSHALYLDQIDAEFKVAFDIAFTYLKAIPASTGIVPIQGDAEYLPFKPSFFDIIIIADILEHLIHPENLIKLLSSICDSDTHIFVHIPWEEDLTPYLNAPFEFTHLRSFNAYTYSLLWLDFDIRRCKDTFPALGVPLIFRLEDKVFRYLYSALVWCYFFAPDVAKIEAEWRQRWYKALPKGEWWLLYFYKPVFRIYEMRRRNSGDPWWFRFPRRIYGWLRPRSNPAT